MDTLSMQAWIVPGVFAMLAAAGLAARPVHRKIPGDQPLERFGPHCSLTVSELGRRSNADPALDEREARVEPYQIGALAPAEAVWFTQTWTELKERRARVERFQVVALVPAEAHGFTQAWNCLQSRFVDDPRGVVAEADLLVRKLMVARGGHVSDFDREDADSSVDRPAVVEHYRAAQAIAGRDRRGEADTEQQRLAVVAYRALLDELLELKAAVVPPLMSAQPATVLS
jgi:hypothetical protein